MTYNNFIMYWKLHIKENAPNSYYTKYQYINHQKKYATFTKLNAKKNQPNKFKIAAYVDIYLYNFI